MKCEECQKEGKKSFVNAGMGMSTCSGSAHYYDEEGEYHVHDMNTTSYLMTCSNGHSWQEHSEPHSCPAKGCVFNTLEQVAG